MSIKSLYITFIFLLFGIGVAHSTENCITIIADSYADTISHNKKDGNVVRDFKKQTDIEIHFKLNKVDLDLNYMGNDESLRKFAAFIDSVGISHIDSVVIVSQSSPEGYYQRNMTLSEGRANAMREYMLKNYPSLSERLYVSADGESWGRLREYVKTDTIMNKEQVDKFLSIIDADVNLETKKWRMKQQPTYNYLYKNYYHLIRNSKFQVLYFLNPDTVKVEPVVPAPVDTVVSQPVVPAPVDTVVQPVVEEWQPCLHVKTNLVGLGMAIANLAVEIDLAQHWSFAIPVYYSSWNYFKETIKFRTFAVQPEIRYWFNENNRGFFAGAHFGLAYYNLAFDGEYRYQDRSEKTPAIGGGLSLGYRLPISRNKRWNVEFAVGGGIYDVHYDKFRNTPNTVDGLLVESIKESYIGLDNAAITFSYAFNLNKKGGKQ